MTRQSSFSEKYHDSCYAYKVETKAVIALTSMRAVRRAVVLWCLCFLTVSTITPVSAALMLKSDLTNTAIVNADAQPMGDHAMTKSRHHDQGEQLHCDNAPCNQEVGCLSSCIHCSVCSFTAAPASTLTPFGELRPTLSDFHQTHSPYLPIHRAYPPYRPPITLR